MKAITNYSYGGPEVLTYSDIETPIPVGREVLIDIHATAINPLDWHVMRGTPYFMRLMTGILRPKKFNVLGADISGKVIEIGSEVTQFEVGDEVFGDIFNFGLGGLAEYACVSEEALVHKPANLSFEAAAAVPVAALTAWHGLRKFGTEKWGKKVLINGASGGVGTFAVQIANSCRAHVTGVCSTRNVELVRSIGADHVIDYTQNDLAENEEEYDLILDAVGNLSLRDYKNLLAPGGHCAVVGFGGMEHLIKVGLFGGRRIKMVDFKANQEDLLKIKELLETGIISSVIDRTYPLAEAREAMIYLETSRARGKVIITNKK
ncbi:MAG: NAD(P)-dependent alcohol dehydrogenase [Reichenbachiella sp.]|uniref:NAD(P)-dependent alcohol dehydrogenase n=1 Tax=Reichenbachiella sp. TaxID=2184521 RepID=UPI00326733B2